MTVVGPEGSTVVGEIGPGLCVLVGVTHDDTKEKAAQLARKLWSVRMLSLIHISEPTRPY